MANKCAHPACSYIVPEGRMYCTEKCASGNPGNAKCGCGHLDCKGR